MVFEELNSFVWKFSHLWASGSNATLILETHAGEACASLRLCLGIHPCRFVQKSCEVKKSESPARRKRREKRAAEARIKVKVTTDASNSKRESESAENVNSDPVDSVTSSVCDGEETNTQAIVEDNDSDQDYDSYTFNYWDDTCGTVLDAIKTIEEKLKVSFLQCKIKESERKFKICEA